MIEYNKMLKLKRYNPHTERNYIHAFQNFLTYFNMQNVFRKALLKSGITKPATVHILRHSFEIHLLERGTDLRYIKELRGHANSKTTEIYTHLTKKKLDKIISPLDNLTKTGQL